MPFDPEDLKRSQKLEFEVEVRHCSCCPLGAEADEAGDFVGIYCSVTGEHMSIPECFEVPRNCPLRRGEGTIILRLKGKK